VAGRRHQQATIRGAKVRPRYLAAQDLELVTKDEQLDVFDIQTAAAPNERSEQRPEREVEKREGHGRRSSQPARESRHARTGTLQVSLPVIAAGGIATARGVAAALAAGADGVRLGTRFIAAAESDAHPAWVRAVIDAGAEDALVSSLFNVALPEPGPHRVLRSSIEAAETLADDHAGVLRLAGAEIPVPRFGAQPPTRDSTGALRRCRSTPANRRARCTPSRPAAEIMGDSAAAWPRAPDAGTVRREIAGLDGRKGT
jgi:Nitronate monooxygenase